MADIFISYSKADHTLASKLSTFLEAKGWSVWWDKSLGAADLYRDEIMKQLAAARAVKSIWTPNSIRSDWVRAEAGRAKADGKLIPVKTPDVAYADIPLPFGEMRGREICPRTRGPKPSRPARGNRRISEIRTPADVPAALASLASAVGDATITIEEATANGGLLQRFLGTYDTARRLGKTFID